MKQLCMCLVVLLTVVFTGCASQQYVVWTGTCCEVTKDCEKPVKQVDRIGIIEDIFFDWDKDVLRDDQVSRLDRIAYLMEQHQYLNIVLEGYASVEGDTDYNLDLSNRRVETVRQELIKRGVSEARIENVTAKGETDFWGSLFPKNRRVLIMSVSK